jgi:hypothetical protein
VHGAITVNVTSRARSGIARSKHRADREPCPGFRQSWPTPFLPPTHRPRTYCSDRYSSTTTATNRRPGSAPNKARRTMRTRGKSALNLHPPNTQNVTRFPRDTENLATGPAPPAGGPTMASRASDGTHGRYPSQAWVDSDPRPFGRSRSLRALLTGASRARSGDVLLAKRERRIPAASTSCRSSVFAGSSRLSELSLQPCPAICCFHRLPRYAPSAGPPTRVVARRG